MARGTDGRFYDPHFDYDGDGRLDAGESMLYHDTIAGHHGSSKKNPGVSDLGGDKPWEHFKVAFVLFAFVSAPAMFMLFPGVGIIMISAAIDILFSYA